MTSIKKADFFVFEKRIILSKNVTTVFDKSTIIFFFIIKYYNTIIQPSMAEPKSNSFIRNIRQAI